MNRSLQDHPVIRLRSRLQVRMTITYVWVTVIIVLLLEIILSSGVYLLITRSPLLSAISLYRVHLAAQIYASEAASQSHLDRLNPQSTFIPDQQDSLSATLTGIQTEHIPDLPIGATYIASELPGSPPVLFALLIRPDGTILATSDPARYPPSGQVLQILPDQAGLIQEALNGKPQGILSGANQDSPVSYAQPVMGAEGDPIGAVLVQSQINLNRSALLSQITGEWIRSSIGWLLFMLPFGAIFGLITTRGLARRVNRLVDVTARIANGDYSQRITPGRPDEIRLLEQQVNQMAAQLVDSIAREKALSEENARIEERARMEEELRAARYIQSALLPKEPPSNPGWQFDPLYQPAREVGGDLYDFLTFPDGQIGIVIGDSTGKGITAALLMATTCTMLRSVAAPSTSPGEVLGKVNNSLHQQIPSGVFATCFYAVLDLKNGKIRYANAGHPLPIRLDGDQASELNAVGMPLGLMPEQQYEEHVDDLAPDSVILFYTDGLVEAHNPQKEMYGIPRLLKTLQDHLTETNLNHVLIQDLQTFSGSSWEQEDDVTLVTIRRKGTA